MEPINRKPQTIDEYFAWVNADHRDVLQKLRQTIHAVAPNAEECISYAIPAFRLNGRVLVGFAAWSKPLLVLPDEFQDVEKVSERAKEFSNQQRHASLLSRQTDAGRIGEEAA
jgi:uncharacterized protein YdhG (YjbR/CyaY superfamily)